MKQYDIYTSVDEVSMRQYDIYVSVEDFDCNEETLLSVKGKNLTIGNDNRSVCVDGFTIWFDMPIIHIDEIFNYKITEIFWNNEFER